MTYDLSDLIRQAEVLKLSIQFDGKIYSITRDSKYKATKVTVGNFPTLEEVFAFLVGYGQAVEF